MQITTPVPNLSSQLAEVIRLYFNAGEDIIVTHEIDENDSLATHTSIAEYKNNVAKSSFTIHTANEKIENRRRLQKAAKIAVYNSLVALTGKKQPWGSLTGVRPSKLYGDTCKSGVDPDREFTKVYGVSQQKTDLCKRIDHIQSTINIPEDGFGLYIGIPFCVSRCTYCSFPGRIAKKGEMEEYLSALLMEMEDTAARVDMGKCFSVYIGGGTPTSFDDILYGKFIQEVSRLFGSVDEITVEAGRPDTITVDKLNATIDAGVNRICVNPQTMVDNTLELIGRKHSSGELEEAYYRVRDAGFKHVNMDIIAGLPTEGVEEFTFTLDRIKSMGPESLTCHTLSIKHGSKMNEFGPPDTDGYVVGEMVSMAGDWADAAGMNPYYLYRQKYMAGNHENTGYAKPGYECIYNIANMGEQSSIIALGTGAITKVVDKDIIRRYSNPRDVFLYIQRVKERKGRIHPC